MANEEILKYWIKYDTPVTWLTFGFNEGGTGNVWI